MGRAVVAVVVAGCPAALLPGPWGIFVGVVASGFVVSGLGWQSGLSSLLAASLALATGAWVSWAVPMMYPSMTEALNTQVFRAAVAILFVGWQVLDHRRFSPGGHGA